MAPASACPAAGTNPSLGVAGYVTGGSPGSAAGIQYAPHGEPSLYFYGNNLARVNSYNNRLQMSGFIDRINNSWMNEYLSVTLNWYPTSPSNPAANNGNLIGATYQNGGATNVNGGNAYPQFLTFSQSYTYDGVNRLTSVTDTGASCPAVGSVNLCYSRNFGYDAVGNMFLMGTATISEPTAPTSASQYSANNQLITGTYDEVGNQTLVNANTLSYDAEGRLASVTSMGTTESYVYDGDGRRVAKWMGGSSAPASIFVYDAMGRMAAEYNTAASPASCLTCYLSRDQIKR